MTSLSQAKLLTQILNLESVRVTKYRNLSGIGLIIHLEALTKEASCARCGQPSHQVHQNHRYLVKDLPISGQAIYLEVNRRQFKCNNCGKPFSEELDFVNKRRQYTSRLAKEIVRQVKPYDIKTVAENNDVSIEEIETMLKDYGRELKEEKPSGLKKLGLDEIGTFSKKPGWARHKNSG